MIMENLKNGTLCILGCGNLGAAILRSLIKAVRDDPESLPFSSFLACVRSERSQKALQERFTSDADLVTVSRGDNLDAVQAASVVILGVDPADIAHVLATRGLKEALASKLLVSIAAGWTRQQIEKILFGAETTQSDAGDSRAWVVRTLPNIAASVSQSLTAIEVSEPAVPAAYLELTEKIFDKVGRTARIPSRLMDATTAVAGSTPAFFAIICDALIDAAVAVGLPRDTARVMVSQSMLGTATMLSNGTLPADLRDQGTSPEGCTIAGLMVLEEGAVRGHVGRALREAVTVARLMGKEPHVNDTRR